MEFANFSRDMLGITTEFGIVNIKTEESPDKVIEIHLKYLSSSYTKEGVSYKLYDTSPTRKRQHLRWFDYKYY